MISSVQIESFRGVREGRLEGLLPLSILVGPNNSGKSTCLEAIAVAGAGDAQRIAYLLLRRGGPPLDALKRIVTEGAKSSSVRSRGSTKATKIRGGDIDSRILVGANEADNSQLVREAVRQGLSEPLMELWIEGTDGRISTYVDMAGKRSVFVDNGSVLPGFDVELVDVDTVRAAGALEDAYSRIERAGKVDDVVQALQRSMSGLHDLRILKSDRDFILHTFSRTARPVPAYLAGDGFKRFLELAAATADSEDAVILLEEPETYQHPRYLKELATLLMLAVKSGTQVILSTHSMELIDLLLHAPEAEGLEYPVIFRLRLLDGKLSAVRLLRDQAIVARDELLEDLRA